LLLWGLLRKIAPRFAGMTALLFTIHPIQVETVAWITERKNLLSLFLTLLAFHAFLKFEKTRQKRDYGWMLFFYTAALFSKTVAVCFATVPLLYSWWEKGIVSKRTVFLSLPLFIAGGVFGFITVYFEGTYAAAQNVLSLTLLERIVFVGKIFFFYLKQALFPWKFMFFYPLWDPHRAGLTDWLYPAAALGLFLLFFLNRHKWGRGGFALLGFYGISLFPALGFFDLFPMRYSYVADHFSYFSVPAVFLLLCAAGSFLFSKINLGRLKIAWHPSGFFKKSIAGAMIVYLSLLSFRLTLNYKNELTLWYQLLLQNPRSVPAMVNLGVLMPRDSDARFLFQKAIATDPTFHTPYKNLAFLYERNGSYEKAIRFYQRASAGVPPFDQTLIYDNIARIYLREKKPEAAVFYLERVLALQKDPLYQKQKQILLKRGRFDPSLEVSPYAALGDAYLLQGQRSKAIAAFLKAVSLDPRNVKNYNSLGAALMSSKNFKNAAEAFKMASALDPEKKGIKKNPEIALDHAQNSPKDQDPSF